MHETRTIGGKSSSAASASTACIVSPVSATGHAPFLIALIPISLLLPSKVSASKILERRLLLLLLRGLLPELLWKDAAGGSLDATDWGGIEMTIVSSPSATFFEPCFKVLVSPFTCTGDFHNGLVSS